MREPVYVLDSHALIFHLQATDSLSPTADSILRQIDAGEATALVPSIVLVEMVYLAEKRRISAQALDSALSSFRGGGTNYQLIPLGLAVIEALSEIPRETVPDMPDRIIAATALSMRCPLLSKDSKIHALENVEVVW